MNKVLVGGVVLAVLLSVVAYFSQPDVNSVGERVSTLEKVVNGFQSMLGATPGTDFTENCISVGGVRQCSYSQNFASGAATTTACSIRTPAATSTLQFASGNLTTATGTALLWEWARSDNSNAATGTLLATVSVGADAKATILASTTFQSTQVDPTVVFPPSSYLNLKWGGAALGNQIQGRCKASFIEN